MTTYAFDPTGTLSANYIPNEAYNVTVSNGVNAYLIVPDFTPFYKLNFSIVNSSGYTLVEGTDFYFTHPWSQGTSNTGLEVYGSITLISSYAVDLYRINYQTLGGEYVIPRLNTIVSGIIASSSQFVNIDWSTAPAAFPSLPHNLNLSALNGMAAVLQGLSNISNALQTPTAGLHYNDIVDMDYAYLKTTMNPMLDLIESVGINNQAESTIISNVLAQNYNALINSTLPTNLSHYVSELPGGLIVKIGTISFTPAAIPTFIYFDPVTSAFPNTCFYVGLNVGTSDGFITTTDTFVKGIPSTTGVNISITLGSTDLVSTRTLTYFAIGN